MHPRFAPTFLVLLGALAVPLSLSAQTSEPRQAEARSSLPSSDDSAKDVSDKIPFGGMDLTWINGQNRQTDFPLVLTDKRGETIVTATAFADAYYNYNFARPIDNTQTISAAIGRTGEVQLNMLSVGIESYYKNVIGRLWLQYGQMGSIVQDLDGTAAHGRNQSIQNLKYIREAAAGYHFDTWYGINVEAGIFMSYIGLESYVLNENWSYQRSMPCDFTPFYFQGARIQAFPTRKLKQEVWLINGWQTYNGWNRSLGIGSSTYFRPSENLQLVANFYLAGKDTRNNPDVLRFHHDNSVVARYYNRPQSSVISQAAFSINTHYGFQTGNLADGTDVEIADNNMVGIAVSNRTWFLKNKLALTLRGDYVTNPGGHLAFSPSPIADNAYSDAVAAGKTLSIFQGTATLDVMPSDRFTFRLEYGYRSASVPFFAGEGGTTSPDGYADTDPTGWRPDLQDSENRITAAVSFRL